jgi:hypothetical protein
MDVGHLSLKPRARVRGVTTLLSFMHPAVSPTVNQAVMSECVIIALLLLAGYDSPAASIPRSGFVLGENGISDARVPDNCFALPKGSFGVARSPDEPRDDAFGDRADRSINSAIGIRRLCRSATPVGGWCELLKKAAAMSTRSRSSVRDLCWTGRCFGNQSRWPPNH